MGAQETLDKFMVNGWPDESIFTSLVSGLLEKGRRYSTGVRAFGEMVVLLWASGQCGATVRLEHLWHRFCQRERFPLFCAYPKSGFTENTRDSMRAICEAHSKVVGD